MESNGYDLVVIGAGPGGEVGAIRAAQLGLKVALVEKKPHLGGTCLNVGCIPTKALIESAKLWSKLQHAEKLGFQLGSLAFDWGKIQKRKDEIVDAQRKGLQFLMKKNKVTVFTGHGRFLDRRSLAVTGADGQETRLTYRHCLLATGSKVRELAFAPTNHRNILSSDSILALAHIPETLAIIGGGVVGMEFASLFAQFGSAVTVFELAAQVLPSEDAECAQEVVRQLKKKGVKVLTQAKLEAVKDGGDHCLVSLAGQAPQPFAMVLMAAGREPVTKDLGLDQVGVRTDERGFIKVDSHYKTSAPNVFAIGDCIGTPALAHTASAEAKHAVEVIAGHTPPLINYEANPSAIYTAPEVASIGLTEARLQAEGIAYKVAKFPFAPMAKAKIEEATEGFIKILYDPQYHELLGVHIVGAKATELISEFVLGKILETTIDEIGRAIHPHPTIAETIGEAAHIAEGGAIHL